MAIALGILLPFPIAAYLSPPNQYISHMYGACQQIIFTQVAMLLNIAARGLPLFPPSYLELSMTDITTFCREAELQ